MKQYTASTTIQAPPQTVWKILTDAGGYPAWDLSMDHIEGKLAAGETVKFFTRLSPQAFPVRVTVFEPNRRLVLTGGCRWDCSSRNARTRSPKTATARPASGQRRSSAAPCSRSLGGASPT